MTDIITRPEIADLAKISRSKLSYICREAGFNFPAPIAKLMHNKEAYSRAEVLAWMARNDLKAIAVSSRLREKLNVGRKKRTLIHVEEKPGLTGLPHNQRAKVKPASPDKPRVIVHLKERNDYVAPHSGLNPHSRSDSGNHQLRL